MSLVLGVDGGGTSTTAWLAGPDGKVLGRGVGGPSNIKAVGAESARASLDRAIAGAFQDARLDPRPVEVSCFGLAGFDRPEDKDWLGAWAGGSSWGRRLVLVNDGDLVVAAGTPEGWGVGVIAGTGSIAVGRSQTGKTARSGGWGHLIGDEGSGYRIALAGLRLVARRADGRSCWVAEKPDVLTARLSEALGIRSTTELVSAIYRKEFDRARIASMAPAVVAAGEVDPIVTAEILEPAGFELAEMVGAVARRLEILGGNLPLACAGSFLLNCSSTSKAMESRLTSLGYKVEASAVREPVQGALVLALRAMNS